MLYSHPHCFWHLAFHWCSVLIKRREEGDGEKEAGGKKVCEKKNKRNSCQGIRQSNKACRHRDEHSLP